jgi:hypothetical protein
MRGPFRSRNTTCSVWSSWSVSSRFSAWSTWTALAVFAVLIVAGPASAHAPHPDEPELFSPSFFLFPDHQQVMSRLDALEDHPWMTLHHLGTSPGGRDIRLVEVVHPDGVVPVQQRPTTLLLTQQHGNEPAGTPAVLDLLEEIAAGHEIAGTLVNQNLLVLPMANPDGSDAGARGNADGVDTNRDHNHLHTVESELMHKVLNGWTVHVALDHHEYGGTGLGNPVPLRVYDFDLTTLVPTHAGVHPAVMTMARGLQFDGIWPLAEAHGYSANEYGEVTLAGEPVGHLAGGPDPGILRNHLGLHHVAGILIETRIDAHPNPFHDVDRRVHIQYLTMVATLEYVHEHAELFVAMREQAVSSHIHDPPEWYDEGDWSGLTDVDAGVDGEDRPRERIPPAFLVYAEAEELRQLLARHGFKGVHETEEGVVFNLDDGHPVHAAALFSSASSRQVLEAEATQAVMVEGPGVDEQDEAVTPGVGVLGVLGVLGLVLWRVVASRR